MDFLKDDSQSNVSYRPIGEIFEISALEEIAYSNLALIHIVIFQPLINIVELICSQIYREISLNSKFV